MKSNEALVIAMLGSLFAVHPLANAADVAPVLLQKQGVVTSKIGGESSKPVGDKGTFAVGALISTGRSSSASIALTPDAGIQLMPSTDIQVIAASAAKTTSNVEVALLKGSVTCTLKSKAKPEQKYRLIMGEGEAVEAVGTAWKATNADGKKTVAVTSGTVAWTGGPGGKQIPLAAGSVLSGTYKEGKLAVLTVTDLVKGTVSVYPVDGGPPVTTPATAEQLAAARGELDSAINTPGGVSTSTSDASSVMSLLATVNQTLQAGGLEPLSQSPVAPVNGGSNDPDSEVSAISPR